MKTVHLKMRVNCDVCFRDFFDSMTLRLHKMREHLENTTETSYKCGTCNKIFLFKSQYNFHLKTSHKIVSLVCKIYSDCSHVDKQKVEILNCNN